MNRQTQLAQDVLAVLRAYADRDNNGDYEYVNPHLINSLLSVLDEYGVKEDEIINKWATDMWSA